MTTKAKQKDAPETPEALTPDNFELVVKGEVVATTFPEFESRVRKAIEVSSKIEPQSDEDFGWCKEASKQFKSVEQAIAAGKEAALKQASDIYQQFARMDELDEDTRAERLRLDRLVVAKTAEVKKAKADEAIQRIECADHLRERFRGAITEAMKNKRTPKSMQEAIEVEVSVSNRRISEASKIIDEFVRDHGADLVADRDELAILTPESVKAELRRRIEAKQARDREAAAKREAEEAKKQAEEARKAAQDAAKPPEPATPPEPPATPQEAAQRAAEEPPADTAPEDSPDSEWDWFRGELVAGLKPVREARENLRHAVNRETAAELSRLFADALAQVEAERRAR